MKTVRLFLETANLVKGDTKILVSTDNRMEDSDIEDILDEGFDQKSDELITLKINTIQENTGRETMDLVVLYGVLKSRLTGDVQAALFDKLGSFYKEGFPKLKAEAAAWGESLNDKIISSSTIDEYEKQIQFLVPDDYDDSDVADDGDDGEDEKVAAVDEATQIEEDGKKTKIFAIAGSLLLAFGLFLGYQMLKPAETVVAKDKQIAQEQEKKNNKSSNSSNSNSNNSKSNKAKNNKKASHDTAAEAENIEEKELNPEESADTKTASSDTSSSSNTSSSSVTASDGASSSSGSGSNMITTASAHSSASTNAPASSSADAPASEDAGSNIGVSMDTAMSELSDIQKNSIETAFGLTNGGNYEAFAITRKRQSLKNIGEAIERFSAPKRCQNFVDCWKKIYPNDRLDFDLYLLEKAYKGSPYKLEDVDWNEPAFASADVDIIKEIDRIFIGSKSDFAGYINATDSDEVAILNDINNAKTLHELSLVFKKEKCTELFESKMTIENLKTSIEDNLNPNNSNSKISDEIFAKFSDFRNKKENINLNNRQLKDAFVKDMIREAQKESASVELIHSDFQKMIEAIKAVSN